MAAEAGRLSPSRALMEAASVNWMIIIVLVVGLFFVTGWMRGGRARRKAPNILGDNGLPRPENREGAVRNDEE